MYPIFLAFALMALLRHRFRHRVKVIRQRMIDAEYVVEERVENYDPSKEVNKVEGEGREIGVSAVNEDEGDWVDDDEGEEDVGAE